MSYSISMSRVLACVVAIFTIGERQSGLTAEHGWPHWRGPNRNDVLNEPSGWESDNWLPQKPAWTTEVGEGSTSPVVVDSRLYTMGWQSGQDRLVLPRTLWENFRKSPAL